MPNEQTRNIVVYLGLVCWEPSLEEQALEEFARTAVRFPYLNGGPNDHDVKMNALLVKPKMEQLCDFLARFYDGLAEETGAKQFRIRSKVRFYNWWARSAESDSTSKAAIIEQRLGAKRDEVEITIFTGRKKLFMGDEVAATFSVPLGDGSEEDEERIEAAFNRAVPRIRAASKQRA